MMTTEIFMLTLLILIGIIMFNIYKYNILKARSNYNLLELQELSAVNTKLQAENIEFIKKIENLTVNLKLVEESQEQALKNSKAALYDLSNSVANQLIELHKKETEEARKKSEEKLSETTKAFSSEMQKIASLVGALTKDMESSKAMVENIKTSLLSPSSAGALAEITLENLLKNSGLKQDIDYILQFTFSSGDSAKLRPDAVIFLPDDGVLIIDAKSSQFFLSENSEDQLVKSMQIHLKNLVSRDYTNELQEYFSRQNRKFRRISTLMFLPTEQALDKLYGVDKNFMQKAHQYNIYPAGPSGLMNVLSIAKMHISEKSRLDNYEQILSEINSLINSIGIISEHGARIGSNIANLAGNYDKFAASFNRNLVSKVKNLKVLGASNQAKSAQILERYQLISQKNELIETAPEENTQRELVKVID